MLTFADTPLNLFILNGSVDVLLFDVGFEGDAGVGSPLKNGLMGLLLGDEDLF